MAGNNADEIILNPKEIARNYLRSWFVLDLISSLPLDYVITLLYPDPNSATHILHAGKSMSLHLLHCLRFQHYSNVIVAAAAPGVMAINESLGVTRTWRRHAAIIIYDLHKTRKNASVDVINTCILIVAYCKP